MSNDVDSTTNKWAILGLIACDASYQSTIASDAPLGEFFDSRPNRDFLPLKLLRQVTAQRWQTNDGEFVVPEWKAFKQVKDPGTGFGAVIYQSGDKSKAIVAFTGTNGPNGQDWWSNVNLGMTQWTQNGKGQEVLTTIYNQLKNEDGTPFSGELLFTGQSLGGALAEYAAYTYAKDKGALGSNIRLMTFNGLGGVDGISKNPTLFGAYDPNKLGSAQVAHFYINNDLVSRLGGGHLERSPSGYVLESYIEHPQQEIADEFGAIRIEPSYKTAQSFIDAHRIESGFYRHFAKYQDDFTAAKEQDIVPIVSAALQQRGAAFAGFLSNQANYSEAEAWGRVASSAGAMLAFMGAGEIPDFENAVDAFAAHLAAASDPQLKESYDQYASRLKAMPFDPVARGLGLALSVLGWSASHQIAESTKVASVLTASPLGNWLPESIRTPLAHVITVPVTNPVLLAKAAVGLATLAKSVPHMDGTHMPILGPDEIATSLAAEEWEAELIGYVTKEALDQGKPAGTVLAEFGRGLTETAEPVLKVHDPDALAAMYVAVGDAVVGAAKAIGNAYDELTNKAADALFDVGTAISRITLKDVTDGVLQVLTGSTNAYGGDLRIPKESLDAYSSALAEAAQVLEDAGQAVVVRPGFGTNPFDTPAYADENNVSVNNLREGGVSTFTLYLPFAAHEDGQRVKLKLLGPNADKFQVLRYADPVPVASDGTFELIVPEGARQVVFSVRAVQDVDSDAVLSLDAQLFDNDDEATHRNHTELTVNFDAATEAPPTIATTVSGTTLDDNRNSTGGRRPVVGTNANNRVQGLAGRDEVSGSGGDDIVEGGAGIDVATGDGGDDQVFGDVALTEAQVQALITSSATATTNGVKPAKLFVTSSEWLQGGLGTDIVVGTAGHDIVFGGGGKDLLVGGVGHDLINGDDSFRPGDITTAYVETSVGAGAPFNNYYYPILSDAGSVGDEDVIHAGSGDDVVSALFGNDTVWGDDGNDVVSGGSEDDSLFGGNGNDQIAGDSYGAVIGDATAPFIGDDFISGDEGDDKLYGDGGEDTLIGGDGNDELRGNNNIAESGVSPTAQDDGNDYLSGGAGNDNLAGDSADDIIDGDDGDDMLLGDSDATPVAHQGSDHLDGGAGNDGLRGYGGDDLLVGGDGDDALYGDEGDDAIFADDGEDTATGGDGADFMAGGGNNDTLLGGKGDDELEGDGGNDLLTGEEGSDRIVGNDGDDSLFGDSETTAGANVGDDYLDGGSGKDSLRGFGGDDELHGGTGDDQLQGEAGDDTLSGDAGNDAIDAGDGNDTLDGGTANDTLWGEDGDDRLDGGLGVNALFGGDGNDTFLVNDIAVNWVNDFVGTDRLEINTVQSVDEIVARRNAETDDLVLTAAGGMTIIVGGMQGTGPQTIVAGDGSTTSLANLVAAANANTGVTNPPAVGTSGDDWLDGTPDADAMMAYEGNDTVLAYEGDDRIDGGPGNDWLIAGPGADEIVGGTGDDDISGNDGDDALTGGQGNDWLHGGLGADRYFFSRGDGQDRITDDGGSVTPGEINQVVFGPDINPEDIDVVTDGYNSLFLNVRGTSDQIWWDDAFALAPPLTHANAWGEVHFADGTVWSLKEDVLQRLLTGTAGDDEINGTTGNDVIDAGEGDDEVRGGAGGNDTVHAGAGNDWIAAGGYSAIYGDDGDDIVNVVFGGAFGGAGDDVLDNVTTCGDFGTATVAGGPGNDRIAPGGAGSVVRFGPGDGHDVVEKLKDYYQWGGPNELETEIHFTGGIHPEDVSAARQDDNLLITVENDDAGSGGNFLRDSAGRGLGPSGFTYSTIELIDYFAHPTIVPNLFSERFIFDDDSGVSAQWLIDRGPSPNGQTITGTAGTDALNGSDGADIMDGLAGPDNLRGGAGADTLRGGTGFDVLAGGFGDDSLAGGDGDDYLSGNAGNDTLNGDAGNDTLQGNRGNNRMYGGSGDDVLQAVEGDDTLDGGIGDDTLTGGSGSNVYVFDLGYGTDTIKPRGGKDAFEVDIGTDTVEFGAGIAPADLKLRSVLRLNGWNDLEVSIAGSTDRLYIQDFTGVHFATADMQFRFADGTIWDSATLQQHIRGGTNALDTVAGTDGDDVLIGYDSADELIGLAGNDNLHGGHGNDSLDGGLGADEMEGWEGDDTFIVDNASDVVTDWYGSDTVVSSIDYALPGVIENLTLTGTATTGTGNNLHNKVVGNALGNTLDGGVGHDEMSGGGGDDTYVIDNMYDSIVEARDGGIDTVLSSIGFVLPENVENLRLTGTDPIMGTGNAFANTIMGHSGANALDGGEGADVMAGGGGNDLYYVDDTGDVVTEAANEGTDTVNSSISYALGGNVENLTLSGTSAIDGTGNSLNNSILGNAAANVLDGGQGIDSLTGYGGDDTYVVDAAGDAISEASNAGVDAVQSSVSYTLGSNVENLTLTGNGTISGTGNTLANVLAGGSGDNTLNGAAGADAMSGRAGNDTYVVDNAADAITEAAGEGTDTVQSSLTFTLGANVENLALTGATAINGTGNALNNVLTGNSAANTLNGGAGIDTMSGGAGNDTYVVDSTTDIVTEGASAGTDLVQASASYVLSANVENLTLTGSASINATGNALVNQLTGNAGNNVLDGGGGADTLIGGAGNDTYSVDISGDVVSEAASGGTDTVNSAITYTLGANVENLTLTGAAAINATGNTLANVLVGNSANNVLTGGAGIDTMRGGAGNDTYVVDVATDVVTENVSEGTDLVQSTVTLTLAAHVENLTLTGAAAINGNGNTLANAIGGNAANNVLDGGIGADTLAGGAGNDTYVVDNAADVITEAASSGTDLVNAGVSYSLAANVENLTLTGASAINGTGNTLANTITGNTGHNTLDGGAGADTLIGGAGNDVYLVDNAGDIVSEAASAGTDTINASISYVMAANVEFLLLTGSAGLTGTGSALDNWVRGNTGINVLSGMDGNDTVWGDLGNDTLNGNNGNDLLQGGGGNDTITDAAGNNLLDGGAGTDTLTGGAAREMLIGGTGADTLTTGGGADVIGLNKGDGADTLNASIGSDDTLSLGGGLAYNDLKLRKTGQDLILDASNGDQITLKNWYQSGVNNKSILNLQVVADAMAAFNPASPDPLLNKKVVTFNFATLVSQFDTALQADPTLTSWNLTHGLSTAYIGGSDTAAVGGDFAYDFGHRNALTNIGATPAQSVLSAATFGSGTQTLQAPATLYAGTVRLA